VHADKKPAYAELFLVVLVNVISRELVNLVNNKIPSPKVKIAHAKVNALYSYAGNNAPQTFRELYLDIVVYLGHRLHIACSGPMSEYLLKTRKCEPPLGLILQVRFAKTAGTNELK